MYVMKLQRIYQMRKQLVNVKRKLSSGSLGELINAGPTDVGILQPVATSTQTFKIALPTKYLFGQYNNGQQIN